MATVLLLAVQFILSALCVAVVELLAEEDAVQLRLGVMGIAVGAAISVVGVLLSSLRSRPRWWWPLCGMAVVVGTVTLLDASRGTS